MRLIRLWLLGLLLSFPAGADNSWVLIAETEGIKVYHREVPGSQLLAFKGVKVIPASISKVAEVLFDEDIESKKEWIDMIIDFKILEKSDFRWVTYSSYDLPWPFSDRDYVVESLSRVDQKSRELIVSLRSIAHDKAPPSVGVRAILMESTYRLIALPDGSTETIVEVHTDPGGNLPQWLINTIQKSWPAMTLKKMEAQALRPGARDSEWVRTYMDIP